MTTWLSSVFYETRTYDRMEEGEYYWFIDIEEMPEFVFSVFPFTLPTSHLNFRSPKECIKIGVFGDYILHDFRLLLENTEIAVYRLTDDEGQAILLEKVPVSVCRTLSKCDGVTVIDYGAIESHGEPIQAEMEPLFRHFRLKLTVNDTLDFQKAMEICITLDSYHGKE